MEHGWWGQAVRPRLAIARQVRVAGGGLVAALVVVNLLLGLLPVVFVVATSWLVGRIPAIVSAGASAGAGTPAWNAFLAPFLLAGAAFVGQQALAPVQVALGELMKRRVDGWVHGRIMAAALRRTDLGAMEDPDALDALGDASRRLTGNWETPGMACAGLVALLGRYVRLLGLCVVVGVVAGWPAAAALGAATMLLRHANRAGLRRYSQVWADVTGLVRRGGYLRDLAMSDAAAKEVRVFGLTGWIADRYERAYRTWLAPIWLARRKVYVLPYLAATLVGLAVAVVVFLLIAHRGAGGDISLTELALGLQATVAALMLAAYYPECDGPTQFGMLAAEALRRFEKLSDAEPAAKTVEPQPVPAGSGSSATVRFEGVGFRYPGRKSDVLDRLDLELPAGACTAVVGVNGAGKTTLVKLLARLHEPTAGTVRFGGTDIRAIPVPQWRRQLSVVFQDFIRYELSVADNVAFGAVHAPRDPDSVRRVLDRVGLLGEFERLPEGLDTPLHRAYPNGTDLSGGQWQRVAIARCLYGLDAGARILVMDEPTAALDVRAEAEFFTQFTELTKGATVLLISHRFSSIRHADRIVVLDRGRVAEQGGHDELVAAGGRYADLFELQAERFAHD
ncbi:ABC transporter ATP-binding protein [Virgisporangium aurantiacum]|uniref:ABC transporter ATP-binding protein n=1 Tax=Virgisporangium aurantiacum TaxID=175570 RepID=UPI001EF26944|nr:ABC transporter ATP-binding protein [Virgisporangium aurantiacum]